jgi:hypothetical protein
MQHYRAHIMGNDGHILRPVELFCENDDAAKEKARQLVDGHDVELCGIRRKRHKPFKLASPCSDIPDDDLTDGGATPIFRSLRNIGGTIRTLRKPKVHVAGLLMHSGDLSGGGR